METPNLGTLSKCALLFYCTLYAVARHVGFAQITCMNLFHTAYRIKFL